MCGLSAFLSFDLFLRIVIRRQTLDYYVTSVIAKFPLYIYLQIGFSSQHITTEQALSSGVTKTTSSHFLHNLTTTFSIMSVVRFLGTRVPFSRAIRPFSSSALCQKSLTDSVKETAETVRFIVICTPHRWHLRLRSSTRRLDKHSRAALIQPKRPLIAQRAP